MAKHVQSSTEIQESLAAKAQAAGLPPEELAKLLLLGEIMKAPSAFEQQKADIDAKNRQDALMAQADIEIQRTANLEREQKFCPHRRDDGMLLFTGQVLSNGVAMVRCLRCQKPHAWTASEQEKSQGLNFMDKHNPRAVDESQLIAQEKMFPVKPSILNALGMPLLAKQHESYLSAKGA